MRISKKYLTRIIREERRKLFEDSVDSELENLKKNVHDDVEHIKDLKKDEEDDRDEEERARDHRKDESRRRSRRARRVGYSALRRMIREEHDADWGMGSHEQSRTHTGEDYTGHAGDESETHPGEDYEGDDVEGKAMDAMKAIHDLASAAGVELDADVSGPSDLGDAGEVGLVPVAERALKRRLRRKIREATRKNSRRRTVRRRR
jgi:hypothetical protein